jgi:hypothetical protein
MPKTKLQIIKPFLAVSNLPDGDVLHRLISTHDGVYRFKRPWRDGRAIPQLEDFESEITGKITGTHPVIPRIYFRVEESYE